MSPIKAIKISYQLLNYLISNTGSFNISPMDSLVSPHVPARREDHEEDNHDAEEDEGDGAERDLLKVIVGQCFRHR